MNWVILVKNLLRGLNGVMVHWLVQKFNFYIYKGVERQVKFLSVNVACMSLHYFHSTSINKKWFGCPIPCQKSRYHHFDGLLICLMETILIWYLVLFSFKIKLCCFECLSVLQPWSLFHLDRQIFQLVSSYDQNAQPNSLIVLFFSLLFHYSCEGFSLTWIDWFFVFLLSSSPKFCWFQHFQRFHEDSYGFPRNLLVNRSVPLLTQRFCLFLL